MAWTPGPDKSEPPVTIVFFSFRIMVGIGFAMLAVGFWSGVRRLQGKLYDAPWLHRASVAMGPMGFVAVLAGRIATELGASRSPFTA
jgi:cytochrome d ubiquinol oxidase subunit I